MMILAICSIIGDNLKGMSRILEQIRKVIQNSEKTRYRLSKETGIAQSQLSRLMTGQEGLSYENLEKLADALGVEIIIRPGRPATKNKKKEE